MTAPVQDVIVLLGDSITQGGWDAYGFAQRLAFVYARKLDVINRGLSGYNTEWAIPVLEQCLPLQHDQAHVPKMRLLTIWFGANDATLPFSTQHVPLEKFSANLSKLIQFVTSPTSAYYSPGTKILLITPPPLNSHQWRTKVESRDPPGKMDREFEITAQYAQVVRDVATREGVPVVDVFTSLYNAAGQDETALSKYLSDGLHLTTDGYTIVYDELLKVISEKFPELHYNNLREVFVPWDQVDTKNLIASVTRRKN